MNNSAKTQITSQSLTEIDYKSFPHGIYYLVEVCTGASKYTQQAWARCNRRPPHMREAATQTSSMPTHRLKVHPRAPITFYICIVALISLISEAVVLTVLAVVPFSVLPCSTVSGVACGTHDKAVEHERIWITKQLIEMHGSLESTDVGEV